MLLASTSATIEIKLSYAKTTNHLPCVVSFVDNDSSNLTYTPGANASNTNNTTAITLVSSPASGVQRVIKSLHVYNDDTVQAVIIVTYFDGSTRYDLLRVPINPKDTLVFSSEMGWYVIDTFGCIRSSVLSATYLPPIKRQMGYIGIANGTNKTLTSTSTFACYLGKANRDFSTVNVLWRVNVAAVTITWAELAIATGAFVANGNASLTLLGTALNVATPIASTGLKSSTITAGGKIGDDLWILVGNQATTAAQLQASAVADANQSGWQQAATTTRPSTMASPTSFTVEGTTVRMAGFVYQLL